MFFDEILNRFRFNREKIKPPEALFVDDNDPLEKDDVGAYLNNHDSPHTRARHMSSTARLAIVALGVSMAINAVLSIAVLQMFPLYRVVPMFVTFSDKADQVVTIDPPKANLTSLEILNEANVREYVIARNTISSDPQETINRWGGRIRLMSSPQIYNIFIEETKPIYDAMTSHKFTRSIIIKSLTKPQPGVWRIQIEAIDKRLGSGLTDGGETHLNFVIDMRTINRESAVSYSDRFINPLGFTVVNYSIAAQS